MVWYLYPSPLAFLVSQWLVLKEDKGFKTTHLVPPRSHLASDGALSPKFYAEHSLGSELPGYWCRSTWSSLLGIRLLRSQGHGML